MARVGFGGHGNSISGVEIQSGRRCVVDFGLGVIEDGGGDVKIGRPVTMTNAAHHAPHTQGIPLVEKEAGKPRRPLLVQMAGQVEDHRMHLAPHDSLGVGDNVVVRLSGFQSGDEVGELQRT